MAFGAVTLALLSTLPSDDVTSVVEVTLFYAPVTASRHGSVTRRVTEVTLERHFVCGRHHSTNCRVEPTVKLKGISDRVIAFQNALDPRPDVGFSRQLFDVANDEKSDPGARQRDADAAGDAQEPDLSGVVGANQGEQDEVVFFTLILKVRILTSSAQAQL